MKKLLKALILIIIYFAIVFAILVATGYIKIEFKTTNSKTTDEYINNGLLLEDQNLSKSNGTEDKYYYNQLNRTAKIIYDQILSEKENLCTGTAEIKFDTNTFDYVLDQTDGMDILSEEYQNAVDAIRYDHIELFYVDFSKTVLRAITYTRGNEKEYEVSITKKDDVENYFFDTVENEEQCKNMIAEVEEETQKIIGNAQGSNYQKIQYIHNYLIDNIEYDQTYNRENTRNIYGALIEKEVVCEGYAKSFKYLLDKLEIPCIMVPGQAMNSEGTTENHIWNYVLINDIWYSVDCTWDDPIITNEKELSEELRYKYFCQGDNINQNHFLSETITEGCQKWEYPELYHKET